MKTILGFKPIINNSLFQSLAFMIFIILLVPIRYETNDDLVAVLILSGKDGVDAHSVTIFLSQIFSSFLYFLYQIAPRVPWYGVILLFFTLLGLSAILSSIKPAVNKKRIISYIIFPAFFILAAHSIAYASFTKTTLLLEFGFFLTLLNKSTHLKSEKSSGLRTLVPPLVCILGSLLLRWKLALTFLVLIVPILVFIKHYRQKALLIFLVSIVTFVALDRTLFYFQTDTPEFEQYREFQKQRSIFSDTFNGSFKTPETKEALKSVGWTLEDYYIFKSFWMHYDTESFNTETLKLFLEENSSKHPNRFISEIWKRFDGNYHESQAYVKISIITILILFLFTFPYWKDLTKKTALQILLALLTLFGFAIFLLFYRFVPRIYIPLFLYTIGTTVILFTRPDTIDYAKNSRIKLPSHLLALCFIVFLVPASFFLINAKANNLLYSSRVFNKTAIGFNKIDQIQKSKTILLILDPTTAGGIGLERSSPLSEELIHMENLLLFPFGTQVNHPRYFKALKQFNLESGNQLLKSVMDLPVLFVIYARPVESFPYTCYVWTRYFDTNIFPDDQVQLEIEYDLRNERGYGLVFFKLVEIKTSESNSRPAIVPKF